MGQPMGVIRLPGREPGGLGQICTSCELGNILISLAFPQGTKERGCNAVYLLGLALDTL